MFEIFLADIIPAFSKPLQHSYKTEINCSLFRFGLHFCSMGLVSFPLTSWEWTRNTAIMMNCGVNMLMWVRLLRFYQCSSKLGPMWIMIRKMMAETLWFLAIFTVLILSCGIFIFAVNVPEATPSQPAYYPIEKRNFNQPPAANATNGAPDIRLNRSQDGTDYDYDYYYDYGAAEQAPGKIITPKLGLPYLKKNKTRSFLGYQKIGEKLNISKPSTLIFSRFNDLGASKIIKKHLLVKLFCKKRGKMLTIKSAELNEKCECIRNAIKFQV